MGIGPEDNRVSMLELAFGFLAGERAWDANASIQDFRWYHVGGRAGGGEFRG